MRKRKPTTRKPLRGPLAQKVLTAIRKHNTNPVVDLAAWRAGRAHAEQIVAEAQRRQADLADLDPVHGVYAFAQNQLADPIEQLIELPVLVQPADGYDQAQNDSMPGGPPMSPLRTSFFTAWGFFDLTVGIKRESLGRIAIEVCQSLNLEPLLIELYDTLDRSRLGVYRVDGQQHGRHRLTELVTGQIHTAHVASGYRGQPGELRLVRVLPPPPAVLGLGDYGVVFNTPYCSASRTIGRTGSRRR